ncbi:hypothetical protein WR25_02099 isoform B [Diploscapter pachys]|uniref:Uncharacterized protein n=2 Tax=Diploscapter pachys TaxID=2018661 RepID=A0A2A2K6P3_9BILA|nr:hypothetical protein WR25_02099 isoform B [Diploscapter pachys]
MAKKAAKGKRISFRSTTKSKSTAVKNTPSTSKASISKLVAKSKPSKNAASSKKSSTKAPHKSIPKKAAASKKSTVGKQQQKVISDAKTLKTTSTRDKDAEENQITFEKSTKKTSPPKKRSKSNKLSESEAQPERIEKFMRNESILPSSSALTFRELTPAQRKPRRNTASSWRSNEEELQEAEKTDVDKPSSSRNINENMVNDGVELEEDEQQEEFAQLEEQQSRNGEATAEDIEMGHPGARSEAGEDRFTEDREENILFVQSGAVQFLKTKTGDEDEASPEPELESFQEKYQVQENRDVSHIQEEEESSPPLLQPEIGFASARGAGTGQTEDGDDEQPVRQFVLTGDQFRVQTPNGSQRVMMLARDDDGNEVYVDEDNQILEVVLDEEETATSSARETSMVQDQIMMSSVDSSTSMSAGPNEMRAIEFNFLDAKNVCCGLCGEIVPYDLLVSEHLPRMHPETFSEGTRFDYEEMPYEQYLQNKMNREAETLGSVFRRFGHQGRKISQIRVNPYQMSITELEFALKKKMLEKMGREVPVSLVDKLHARCGICNAIISLNKKFETIHIIRHFNSWHPDSHRCAGTWPIERAVTNGGAKMLSVHDFAVINHCIDAVNNMQCIWCGTLVDKTPLVQHFTEVHPNEVQVPKCTLCLHELVINARMREKFGDDMEVNSMNSNKLRIFSFRLSCLMNFTSLAINSVFLLLLSELSKRRSRNS